MKETTVFVLVSHEGDYSDHIESMEGVFSTRERALDAAVTLQRQHVRVDEEGEPRKWRPNTREPNADGCWVQENSYSVEIQLHEFTLDQLDRELR